MTADQHPAITVLIVDDQVMVASGLLSLLETYPGVRPVGLAHTLADARKLAQSLQPDVIVLDFRLPDGDAPSAISDLRLLSRAQVVILSATSDTAAVVDSLAAGACGFLLKEQPVGELVAAIEKVALGERVLAPALMGPMLDELARQKKRVEVSDRQRHILKLLANGVSTQQMADELQISVNTARNQIQKTIVRVGAHSKLEAVAIGIRENLISRVGGGIVRAGTALSSKTMTQTAVVVESATLVRRGIISLLESSGIRCVGASASATEGHRLVGDLVADLVIIGTCQDSTHANLVSRFAKSGALCTVVITPVTDLLAVYALYRAGAIAVLPPTASEIEFADMLSSVARGQRYVPANLLVDALDKPARGDRLRGAFRAHGSRARGVG